VPQGERRRRLRERLAEEVAAVLSLAPAEVLDGSPRFFDLGLDSLTSLELRNRLRRVLGYSLPATFVFEHANVAELADHLAVVLGDGDPAVSRPVAAAQAERSDERRGLEDLSESEIARLLAAELDAPREDRAT
jgi:acyl carrier protein